MKNGSYNPKSVPSNSFRRTSVVLSHDSPRLNSTLLYSCENSSVCFFFILSYSFKSDMSFLGCSSFPIRYLSSGTIVFVFFISPFSSAYSSVSPKRKTFAGVFSDASFIFSKNVLYLGTPGEKPAVPLPAKVQILYPYEGNAVSEMQSH